MKADEAARASAPSKAERLAKAREKELQENVAVGFAADAVNKGEGGGAIGAGKSLKATSKRKPVKESKSEGSGFTLPSFSSESAAKKKVILSPADDLDDDEKSMARPNQPLLFLLFATPVSIYLSFYVLGSINVI
eukprot:gb/GFBE01080828.1/.p1 GENE.gb/GFBE01080828.1/~~gb/GFBE01080828.1/.p1  ORF type:complete len:135 (+),score=51.76 gb/GFBE01080828.1/:1-405(+)